MGYCPFEHKAGRTGRGALAAQGPLGAGRTGHGKQARRGRARAQQMRHDTRGKARTRKHAGHDAGRVGREALRHDSLALRHGRLDGHDTAAWACLGVLLGQQAVHLVHPACFWTQYYF